MLKQSESVIYLADLRTCSQVEDRYCSYHVFDFGDSVRDDRKPIGFFKAFNDDILKGGSKTTVRMEDGAFVLLLPVEGALKYRSSNGFNGMLEMGQIHLFPVSGGVEYEICNFCQNEEVNFLHVLLDMTITKFNEEVLVFDFDINRHKNTLLNLNADNYCKLINRFDFAISIGKFGGKQKGIYQVKQFGNLVFLFVIEGVFEIGNRLLHSRDGLALWKTRDVTFEALSPDAVLLIIETESF